MSRLACQALATHAGRRLDHLGGVGTDSGFGTLCGSFGARNTASAGLDARPRAVEKPDKAAHHRQAARRRAALDPRGAEGEPGAEIGRQQPRQHGEVGRLAEMRGQEIEKAGEVAAVGGDGVRRGAPLAAEPGHPQTDRGAQILGRGKPRQRHRFGQAGESLRPGRGRDDPRPVRAHSRGFSHCEIVMLMTRARKVSSSVPSPGWNRPGWRVPMHNSPSGAPRPKPRRSSACDRTSPAAPPNSAVSPGWSARSSSVRSGAEQRVDGARLQQMDAVHAEVPGRGGGALDPDRDDVDIEQHGEIGRHGLQQLLEAGGGEDRQHRLVHPALACQSAAAGGDQGAVFEVEPRQVLAQPLDMEMLEIEHPFAELAARRPQQAQRLGVLLEKIGMAAQIGDDVAAADLARRLRATPPRSPCALSRGRSTTAGYLEPGGNG